MLVGKGNDPNCHGMPMPEPSSNRVAWPATQALVTRGPVDRLRITSAAFDVQARGTVITDAQTGDTVVDDAGTISHLHHNVMLTIREGKIIDQHGVMDLSPGRYELTTKLFTRIGDLGDELPDPSRPLPSRRYDELSGSEQDALYNLYHSCDPTYPLPLSAQEVASSNTEYYDGTDAERQRQVKQTAVALDCLVSYGLADRDPDGYLPNDLTGVVLSTPDKAQQLPSVARKALAAINHGNRHVVMDEDVRYLLESWQLIAWSLEGWMATERGRALIDR